MKFQGVTIGIIYLKWILLPSKLEKPAQDEKKERALSKGLKVQMAKSDNSDNSFEGSTDDEVALMSRMFKQMMKKKGKF